MMGVFRRRTARFKRGDVARCWEPDRVPELGRERTVVVFGCMRSQAGGFEYVVKPFSGNGAKHAIVCEWMLRVLSLREEGDVGEWFAKGIGFTETTEEVA